MPSPVSGRRRALQAAAGLLDELEIDQEQPIDVFGVISRLGLWLVFQPIDTFLGAVIPEGSGGIMITTNRRPTIQRYTAAHEIGHWELEHGHLAVDTAKEILGTSTEEVERLAQLFATYFLMPPPLVHAAASRHGVRAGTRMSSAQAYLIACDMHVSYEAALRQMDNLDIISGRERETLLGTPPLEIKRELAHGHRPRNSYADVWPVDARLTFEHHIDVMIEDEIVIALPENRTTGHRWLDEQANARRARRRARPAPAVFATPEYAPPPATPLAQSPPTPQHTVDEIEATLALLPDAPRSHAESAVQPPVDDSRPCDPLLVLSDEYEPGWAQVPNHAAAELRRHVAGADVPLPEALELPSARPSLLSPAPSSQPTSPAEDNREVSLSGQLTPGIGATGQRWITLQACVEGLHSYTLHYAASHDPRTSQVATFKVEASVKPLPQVRHRRLLLDVDIDDDASEVSDGGTGQERADHGRDETSW